jgi:hypothetical protein
MTSIWDSPRIAAALGALVMTLLLIGSQWGIADHYTGQADAVMAAKRNATPVVRGPASAAAQRPAS